MGLRLGVMSPALADRVGFIGFCGYIEVASARGRAREVDCIDTGHT